MQASGIRVGDIVKCDVRGQPFFAFVAKEAHTDRVTKRRVLTLEPLTPGTHIPSYNVTPQQITEHWRKPRARKGSK